MTKAQELAHKCKVALLFVMNNSPQQTVTLSRQEVRRFNKVARDNDIEITRDTEGNTVFRAIPKPVPSHGSIRRFIE
jgi:hypothetical protein